MSLETSATCVLLAMRAGDTVEVVRHVAATSHMQVTDDLTEKILDVVHHVTDNVSDSAAQALVGYGAMTAWSEILSSTTPRACAAQIAGGLAEDAVVQKMLKVADEAVGRTKEQIATARIVADLVPQLLPTMKLTTTTNLEGVPIGHDGEPFRAKGSETYMEQKPNPFAQEVSDTDEAESEGDTTETLSAGDVKHDANAYKDVPQTDSPRVGAKVSSRPASPNIEDTPDIKDPLAHHPVARAAALGLAMPSTSDPLVAAELAANARIMEHWDEGMDTFSLSDHIWQDPAASPHRAGRKPTWSMMATGSSGEYGDKREKVPLDLSFPSMFTGRESVSAHVPNPLHMERREKHQGSFSRKSAHAAKNHFRGSPVTTEAELDHYELQQLIRERSNLTTQLSKVNARIHELSQKMTMATSVGTPAVQLPTHGDADAAKKEADVPNAPLSSVLRQDTDNWADILGDQDAKTNYMMDIMDVPGIPIAVRILISRCHMQNVRVPCMVTHGMVHAFFAAQKMDYAKQFAAEAMCMTEEVHPVVTLAKRVAHRVPLRDVGNPEKMQEALDHELDKMTLDPNVRHMLSYGVQFMLESFCMFCSKKPLESMLERKPRMLDVEPAVRRVATGTPGDTNAASAVPMQTSQAASSGVQPSAMLPPAAAPMHVTSRPSNLARSRVPQSATVQRKVGKKEVSAEERAAIEKCIQELGEQQRTSVHRRRR